MLDTAVDILFEALEPLKQEQIYLARIAGRDEDKIGVFKRRFAKTIGDKTDICVESPSRVREREAALSEDRKYRRQQRIMDIQNKIMEIQGAIDLIKSLEEVGPDDAIEYSVGTMVDENGNVVTSDNC